MALDFFNLFPNPKFVSGSPVVIRRQAGNSFKESAAEWIFARSRLRGHFSELIVLSETKTGQNEGGFER